MDTLTVIPKNKMKMKGISFVKDNFKDAVWDDQDIKNGFFLEIFYKILDGFSL